MSPVNTQTYQQIGIGPSNASGLEYSTSGAFSPIDFALSGPVRGEAHIDFAQTGRSDSHGGFTHLFNNSPILSPTDVHHNHRKPIDHHENADQRDRYAHGGPNVAVQPRNQQYSVDSALRSQSQNNNRETMSQREDYHQHQPLKSSLKYSKPACLQSSAHGNLGTSVLGRTHQSMTMNNRSMRNFNSEQEDLHLRLDKLTKKFIEKHKDKDSFKDTYFDEEIFQEVLDSKNYFKFSLDMLKYILHTANQPKKKVETKKPATGFGNLSGIGRR